VTAGGIAAEDPGVRSRRQSKERATKQIESLMWLGGERSSAASREAIKMLFDAMQAAMTARLVSGDVVATPGADGVRYEWEGFVQRHDNAALALLAVTAHLAAAPLPVTLFADGWGPLPAPLRQLARRPPDLRPVVLSLAERGLLHHEYGSTELIRVEHDVQAVVRSLMSRRERIDAASAALRSLQVALPEATHDHNTWETWEVALPHVLTVIEHCQALAIRADDTAYLLDRAAVFVRDALDDPDRAVRLGREAAALSEAADVPDPVQYGNILGNIGIALNHLGRHAEAADLLRQSAEVTLRGAGELHHEYIASLLVWANALLSGSVSEAFYKYEQAARLAHEAYARQPDDPERKILVEVLNDFAHALLKKPTQDPDRRAILLQAAAMLDEARILMRPGDYGWHQVMVNRADAHAALGEPAKAIQILDSLLPYCRETFGAKSYPVFSVLTALADILEAVGDPRFHAVLAEAHDVDDHLSAPAESRPKDMDISTIHPRQNPPRW
jgi:tetratricopeptide (TPR) repeat protein